MQRWIVHVRKYALGILKETMMFTKFVDTNGSSVKLVSNQGEPILGDTYG